jgi:protein-tyrosine phosphatase
MHKILFVCTGNYYRSRFAEILFNFLASRYGLNWKANSRGILAELGTKNPGSISPYALDRLNQHGIYDAAASRTPIQLTETDLIEADRIIALDQTEHHPLILLKFGGFADQILYWNVHDLHLQDSEEALSAIEKNVFALIKNLQTDNLPQDFRHLSRNE